MNMIGLNRKSCYAMEESIPSLRKGNIKDLIHISSTGVYSLQLFGGGKHFHSLDLLPVSSVRVILQVFNWTCHQSVVCNNCWDKKDVYQFRGQRSKCPNLLTADSWRRLTSLGRRTPTHRYNLQPLDGDSCQSQAVHAPMLYRLFYSQWDQSLQNEHWTVF